MTTLIRQTLRVFARVFVLLVVVIATIWVVRGLGARNMPDLAIWHTYTLESEFHARDYPDGISFEQYQQIEADLDEELNEQIYLSRDASDRGQLNRYNKSSRIFSGLAGQDWNRSFERNTTNPVGGILLLHGASDSPYSVRALSEFFSRQGLYVLALRIPGNGTIPTGLKHATLGDWLSITLMGVERVRERVGPNLPLYLGGYSAGAALVLDYTLDALADTSLVIPDRLFLYSPAIGITKYARFSDWDVALSAIPYFEKFGWMSIQPEYDPYKYNSFAKNAGHITYLLTERLRHKILASKRSAEWQSLPPMITFQSLVDSTVYTGTMVSELYVHLPENGSELILFDINRAHDLQHFIIDRERTTLDRLLEGEPAPFDFTLITNTSGETRSVQARTRLAGEHKFSAADQNSEWPNGVYSLSHVAIPFRDTDPWYGALQKPGGEQFLSLGAISPRGEQGLLTVPSSQFMRLRYNPFFDYVELRTGDFCTECRSEETAGDAPN